MATRDQMTKLAVFGFAPIRAHDAGARRGSPRGGRSVSDRFRFDYTDRIDDQVVPVISCSARHRAHSVFHYATPVSK